MTDHDRERIEDLLYRRTNWGRWGEQDQRGAINLVTADAVLAATAAVRTGKVLSLSRPLPLSTDAAGALVTTAQRGVDAGYAVDKVALDYHGPSVTHLDALCHTWGPHGGWNGRQVTDIVDEADGAGARWGGVEHWADGIVTRGVLLDVPAHRGEPYVTIDRPVTGDELEEVAAGQGCPIRAGDAVLVYSGRDRWDDEHDAPWGTSTDARGEVRRPGLHGSCLAFLRDVDCGLLAWDMMDAAPNEWGLPWTVHGALFSLGIGLVDNCELSRLAEHCRTARHWDCLFIAAPLVRPGATGSPVNPLAVV